jgi:hypothetical protein
VRVKLNGTETLALLDSGAQVNMVSLKFARKLYLPISKNLNVSGISYNGQSNAFYSVVRSAKMILADVIVITPMFMTERHDPKCPVILGRPFQKKGRMSMWNDNHGACHGMVYDEDRDYSVEFQAISITDASNVGFEQLVSSKRSLNYQADK